MVDFAVPPAAAESAPSLAPHEKNTRQVEPVEKKEVDSAQRPPREGMHEARARAAAEEERAAAERARRAAERKNSSECIHIRARTSLGMAESMGCL
jgi:hypothetical protein